MRFAVVRFPGSCDDRDALLACSRFGEAHFVDHRESDLAGFDCVVIPGGFSYGDYLRAGALAGLSPVMGAVRRFAAAGGPVLGICNGFQVLCEAGLLPGALLPNCGLRFVCREVEVEVASAATPFTRCTEPGTRLRIPVKHQSGRYWAPPDVLDTLERTGRVVFRYAPGHNPNGSERNIAGVVSAEGNVVGLMPHPEHAVDALLGSADGAVLFECVARAEVAA
ncbi:MAG: phosphoribosylformylglycinamidine synthase subunit PurQ [Thermoleophilum sp.]|nr:phosphoribosylformylglycinamidine synthase subunit PurQ [Thermoleophilum sp.]